MSPPVLTRRFVRIDGELSMDRGVCGFVQALAKLSHTKSVLYVMAHPDDEDAATLTYLARGQGVRTALFSLTRGEAGDNAVGAEAGAALGALRTQEMLAAAEVYGVEDVLWGTCEDYGYSKRVEEAWQRWGEARVVRDIARAIRITQPDVVISRFSGEKSDGHAHHRAVGLATRRAYEAAAGEMPELDAEGLPPHRAARLFVEVASAEAASLTVPVSETPPWLGMSYADIGAQGHAHHRSQTAGKRVRPAAASVRHYRLVASDDTAPRDSTVPSAAAYPAYGASSSSSASLYKGFHDGLRPGIKELFPDRDLRGKYHDQVEAAQHGFDLRDLSHAVPHLSEMLSLVRRATPCLARDVLEAHVVSALAIALDIRVHAVATPDGDTPPQAFYEPFIGMDDLTLPAEFTVDVDVRGPAPTQVSVDVPEGDSVMSVGERRFRIAARSPLGELPGYVVRAEYASMGVPFAVTVPVCARAVAVPHAERILRQVARDVDAVDMRVPRWPATDPTGGRVARVTGTCVGVVEGTGDCFAAAATMLGAEVQSVSPAWMNAASLAHLDVLVIGVRAHACHGVLREKRTLLTDFAKAGGHVVVFMQTPEYDPAEDAPYAAVLPQEPAEVCEEDANVTLLVPNHPLLTTPNPISARDFDHWIEQRGSKLWASWDEQYTPLVEAHDTDEPAQRGLWLTASVGKGAYTYCALALQRQLPFGVAGAWRIFGNLIAKRRPG